jgi:ceramide glucosyltransferase
MSLICTALTTLLTAFGCLYALLAAACLGALASPRGRVGAGGPTLGEASVSVLKPLCGEEPLLLENLASVARQDYRGPLEVLFGIAAPNDAAANAARAVLRGERAPPGRLLINSWVCGPNPKVATLANLAAAASGTILVAADSDIRVGEGWLTAVLGTLARPGVGLVTCLYRGLPAGGIWSRLSAAAIDHHFLPSVLVAMRLGLAAPCLGATVALRRETLERLGGFAAFAHCLADDYAMGAAVRRLGLKVVIAPTIVDHTCAEATLAELFAHELRWARTIGGVAKWGHAGTVATHPLPFALVGVLCAPGAFTVAALVAALLCRLLLQVQADRALGRSVQAPWWGPVRDLLSFAVYLASLWPGDVAWRGRRHRLRRDGTLA